VSVTRGAEHRWLLRALRGRARPNLAGSLQQYLGSPLPTFAVSAPDLHRIVGEFRRREGRRSSRELRPVLLSLWGGTTYDERILAIELLDRYQEAHDASLWKLASGWVDEATGWALSDSLAAGPIAGMVQELPQRYSELLRWTSSRNLWRRRAATYALHDLVLGGEVERPLRLLKRLVPDHEFWVQRAVGTWLRECWKQEPRRTERFLRRHAGHLAPVTLTVATERAPKSLRVELRMRRASGRGQPHIPRKG
jgi:3-methyladenine DNA glycosylase AlkD